MSAVVAIAGCRCRSKATVHLGLPSVIIKVQKLLSLVACKIGHIWQVCVGTVAPSVSKEFFIVCLHMRMAFGKLAKV